MQPRVKFWLFFCVIVEIDDDLFQMEFVNNFRLWCSNRTIWGSGNQLQQAQQEVNCTSLTTMPRKCILINGFPNYNSIIPVSLIWR